VAGATSVDADADTYGDADAVANSVAERNSYGRSRPGFGRGVLVSSVALVAGLAGLALRRWISGQGAVADRRWRFR
jgi:hypothetical protein